MSNSSARINAAIDQLEFGQIRQCLADLCASPKAIEAAIDLQPELKSIEKARTNLLKTQELLNAINNKLNLQFSDVADIAGELDQVAKQGTISEEQLFQVFVTIRAVDSVIETVRSHLPEKGPTRQYVDNYQSVDSLIRMLDQLLDERGHIHDAATPKLAELRNAIREQNALIHEKLEKLLRSKFDEQYFQDDYITLREDRLVLPVKANMKGKFEGIIHGVSGTAQTYFIEPREVVEANNNLKMALRDERIELGRILRDASNSLRDYLKPIQSNLAVAAEIELQHAKARLSKQLKGHLPSFVSCQDDLLFQDIRHPLLLINGDEVVANSVAMRSACNTLIISGPNAGGKTVLLKAMGLTMLLAQSGILPTIGSKSNIPFCNQILVELGDQQSLQAGLSTFSAHMDSLGKLLNATKQMAASSFLLFDELISNTSAGEGAALAQATAEYLATNQLRSVITTHYAELKNLADLNKAFRNISMEFDATSGSPTYRLIEDVAGDSNAIKMAEHLGLEPIIVKRAIELLHPNAKTRQSLEEKMIALSEQIAATRQREEAAAVKEKELEKEKERLQAAGERELNKDLSTVRRALAEARKRLRELSKQLKPEKALTVKRSIDKVAAQIKEALPAAATQVEHTYRVGDYITVINNGERGQITRSANKQSVVEIQVGAMRMHVHTDEIMPAKPVKTAPTQSPNKSDRQPNREIEFTPSTDYNSVDLRGKTVDDAINATVAFLDRAMLEGPDVVVIIHGHGTNRLKEQIRSHLKTSPYVIKSRPGQEGEGGTGVTLVLLDR